MKYIFLAVFLTFSLSCGNNKKQPAAEEAVADPGKEIFMKYCLACHQTNGGGVPGMYPPIQKTDWVQGDKTRLIGLILNGQKGLIQVNGQEYKGEMPSHQYLTDEQVAQVLTYIRSNYGNQADAITAGEVSKVRSQSVPPK